jgi:hypothetical protein
MWNQTFLEGVGPRGPLQHWQDTSFGGNNMHTTHTQF